MDFQIWDALKWRHDERDGVSNHQPHHCLLNRLFRCRSKKISRLRVTGLCEGDSPVTGEFPAQRASNAENVSIWWRHHGISPWFFPATVSYNVTSIYGISIDPGSGLVPAGYKPSPRPLLTLSEPMLTISCGALSDHFNALDYIPLDQDGANLANDSFTRILLNENIWRPFY